MQVQQVQQARSQRKREGDETLETVAYQLSSHSDQLAAHEARLSVVEREVQGLRVMVEKQAARQEQLIAGNAGFHSKVDELEREFLSLQTELKKRKNPKSEDRLQTLMSLFSGLRVSRPPPPAKTAVRKDCLPDRCKAGPGVKCPFNNCARTIRAAAAAAGVAAGVAAAKAGRS